MSQHKIVKIPDWVLPEAESYINEVGKDGWELVHLYNQHAYMKAGSSGTIVSGSLDTNIDAFGRLRVTDTFTLGDYKHLYAIDENFLNLNVSGSTISFNVNRASVTLATSASAASRAVHQTKMYHNYMPERVNLFFPVLSLVQPNQVLSNVLDTMMTKTASSLNKTKREVYSLSFVLQQMVLHLSKKTELTNQTGM
jgi:hypothetical protein